MPDLHRRDACATSLRFTALGLRRRAAIRRSHAERGNEREQRDKMNIAVFLPNWIGDAVMATPALRALRQHFAHARLIGVLKPYIAGVLEGSPWLDGHVFLDTRGPWANRWPAAAASLRREHIDLAVLFPNSFRSALTAWLGGCRRRAGYVRYGRGLLLTDPLYPVCDERGKLLPCPGHRCLQQARSRV